MIRRTTRPGEVPPAFSAQVRRDRGTPVVKVCGELDLAAVPGLMRAIGIAGTRLDGRPLAFVDLRDVRFIDVMSARKLAGEARAMRELGGELRLVALERGPAARAFELLGDDRMPELYRDIELPANEVAS